jgi:hypothetical protein
MNRMIYRNLIVHLLSELLFFVSLFELRLSQAVPTTMIRQSLISYNPVNLVNPVQLPF